MFKDDAFGELLVSKGLATRLPERATQKISELHRKGTKKSAIRAKNLADGYVPSLH